MSDSPNGHPSSKISDEAAAEIAARQIALDTYSALVDRCAAGRINQNISNGSPFHARILIAKLFEIGKKKIQLVSGSLTDERKDGVEIYAFQNVITQAKKFLRDPGANLSIIVQTGNIMNGENNRFLKDIIEDKERNGIIEITIAKPHIVDGNIPHFLVADSEAYRFEPGANAQPHNESTTAVGNFGDVAFAKNLTGYFATLSAFLSADSRRYEPIIFSPSVRKFALKA